MFVFSGRYFCKLCMKFLILLTQLLFILRRNDAIVVVASNRVLTTNTIIKFCHVSACRSMNNKTCKRRNCSRVKYSWVESLDEIHGCTNHAKLQLVNTEGPTADCSKCFSMLLNATTKPHVRTYSWQRTRGLFDSQFLHSESKSVKPTAADFEHRMMATFDWINLSLSL